MSSFSLLNHYQIIILPFIFFWMYDICCIGHITSDKVVTTDSVRFMPGGTAYYFSYALSKLNTRYLLVTALADAELSYVEELRNEHITVNVQPSKYTVFFENIYGINQDERTQNVLQTADTFNMEQLHDVEATIFHLGPLLANDIPVELIKTLATKGSISIDVQGYLRKLADQKVYPANWSEKMEALPYIQILKADVAELKALTGMEDVKKGVGFLVENGVTEVVITNGSKGSLIYADGSFYDIPAYQPQITVDATGCGDTYMAGYLYKRSKGLGIRQAGEFAAAMAGLKTTRPGPFNGTEFDVDQFLMEYNSH
jgi:sugar/nucleoside kinase (ribokinase family)